MKYPLTNEAKETARYLVSQWQSGELKQEFTLNEDAGTNLGTTFSSGRGISSSVEIPQPSTMRELALFNLVTITSLSQNGYRFLLLQELRNAVNNDFEVSEYFITLNAVGNIIINSNTGTVQGVGINTGTIYQNVQELADSLAEKLGQEFLETHKELKDAILNLGEAKPENLGTRIGNVLSELANCLEHSANVVTIIPALIILAQAIS
jgi:hypothetical protein